MGIDNRKKVKRRYELEDEILTVRGKEGCGRGRGEGRGK